jgi:hypothetical protein
VACAKWSTWGQVESSFVVTITDYMCQRASLVYERSIVDVAMRRNRNKDFKNALNGDRLSCTTYVVNACFALLLHRVCLPAARRIAHAHIAAVALRARSPSSIRISGCLLKVAAQVPEYVTHRRRVSTFGLAPRLRIAARLGAAA